MSTPAVVAALSFAPAAHAADQFWDINGNTAGGASTTTAAGTWNGTNTFWNATADGTGSVAAWPGAGNVAVFSAGTNVTGSYTVTVSGTQAADGLRFEEGTLTLSGGAINFGATTGTIQVNTALTQTISSDIQGTAGWTRLNGTGASTSQSAILTLSGAKTYSGLTTLQAGVTRINNSGGLGVADNTVANGVVFSTEANVKLELSGGINVNKKLQLTNWGADNLGQVQATSGTNTWSGDINVSGQVNNFGTGVATLGASSGATLVVTGEIKDNADFAVAGAGATALAKEGAGTLVLRHSNLNHTGLTRGFNGTIQVEADGALGAATVYTAGVGLNRGTFLAQLSGKFPCVSFANNVNYTTNDRIQTSGNTGTGGRGVIDGGVGNNTYGGDIALSGSSPLLHEISVNGAGDSLTLSGKIYQTGTGTARHVHKIGAGTLIITGHNDVTDGFILSTTSQNSTNDQYHMQDGEINVDGGTLVLKDGLDRLGNPTSGALATNVPIFVNLGATFTLDNSAGISTSRLLNTTALTLSAGEVKLIGNAGGSVNQAAGNMSVSSFSTISVNQPSNTNGATTTFSLGTLNRSSRGTALLRGMDNTSSFIGLSGALKGGGGANGTSTISILTEVVGDTSPTGSGSDFITIDGGFARTLTASEYIPLASGNAALNNTTVTANTAITTDTTVNAIKLSGGNTVTISPTKKLLVSSGGLLGVGAGTSTITGGDLTFQDATIFSDPDTGFTSVIVNSVNEGIVTVPTGSTLTIASNVAGAEGLTKSGNGTLVLSGTNTFGTDNDPVKGVTINAGTLQFGTDANLGTSAAPIILNGGTLNPTSTSTSSRTITLGSPGSNTIDVGTGGSFTVTGVVSGTAAINKLVKNGGGTLNLTNTANSYSGGTVINAGDMILDAANPTQTIFGTGGITLAGGSITATASMTLDKSLVSTSSNSTGGFNIPSGMTITYGSGPTSTVGMSGSGNYAINGGGTLILSHNVGTQMSYTGRVFVNGGSTLVFENNGGTNNIAGIGGTPVQSTQWVVLNGGSRLKFNISSTAGGDFGGSSRGITVNDAGTIDITGTNTLNTFGIMTTPSTATFTKDGTGLLSLRANNSTTFLGKWNVAAGILEIGNAGGNGLALGGSTASDAVTLQTGTTLQGTTTGSTGTVLGGVVLAGNSTLGAKTGTTLTFSNNISGAGNLSVNWGTLTGTVQFSGTANSYTGSTTVANGKLQLLSNVTTTSSASVATGATLQLTSSGLDNFNRVLKTGSVSTAGTGKINIDNNKMVLTAQAVGSFNGTAYTGVTGLIQSGYGPNQDFTGTTGIVTTQSNATGGNTLTNIGVASNADLGLTTFGGVSVGANDTLVMYTYGGDANLDGAITGDDYFQIDSGFPAGAQGWYNGDFNYDGSITGDDYFVIDSNFSAQGTPIPTSAGVGGSGGLAGVQAVPEPASIAVVGLGAMSLLTRRSRRKS